MSMILYVDGNEKQCHVVSRTRAQVSHSSEVPIAELVGIVGPLQK